MPSSIELIDTFPSFLDVWENSDHASSDAVQALWLKYMRGYPLLLQKQIDCYRGDSTEWTTVAKDRVFPLFSATLDRMSVAHGSAKAAYSMLLDGTGARFPIDPQPSLVLYVGIGCGAGWATSYDGRPAILLGLEKVAECGWEDPTLVFSLVAHEYGHLYHHSRRHVNLGQTVSRQAWALFEEGFAQRFDHLAAGSENWALCCRLNDSTWLDWCIRNRSMLAREYLELMQSDKPSNAFFGDWLDVHGKRQVGYYLGHQLMRNLERQFTMEQIAEIADVDSVVSRFLVDCVSGEA